jgi:Tfp pilus assembly protein PilX
MSPRRGFALPAVFAALVLMALLVAGAAQQALMAWRDSALDEARAQLAAATETALAAVLSREVDTLALRAAPPGAGLDSGRCHVGTAEAVWRLTVAAAPVALLSVDAAAPVRGGTARTVTRIWLRRRSAPSGAPVWGVGGSGWWSQLPSS